MEELNPQGEFHHFQLVNAQGEIPVSISVLVRYGQSFNYPTSAAPLEAEDVIRFHEEIKGFDGNFIQAFSANR